MGLGFSESISCIAEKLVELFSIKAFITSRYLSLTFLTFALAAKARFLNTNWSCVAWEYSACTSLEVSSDTISNRNVLSLLVFLSISIEVMF